MERSSFLDDANYLVSLSVANCRFRHRMQCSSQSIKLYGRGILFAPRYIGVSVACAMFSAEREKMEGTVRRGDIFYADLSPVVGSEQGGTRPVLIIQNDTGNKHSPTVIAAAITSQTGKARLPTHINICGGSVGLSKDSIILLEQVRTIDKRRLREHMGKLDEGTMALVDDAILVSFGLNNGRIM